MTRFLTMLLLLSIASLGCSGLADSTDDLQQLKKIDDHFRAGQYDAVVEEATAYVEKHPDSSTGWTLLGWACAKTDDIERADECFDKAIELDPTADNAYVGKGVLLRKQGDTEGARKAYLKAIELLPENAEAYTSLLVIEIMEGNDQKAVEYGEKAWQLRQDDPVIPANLSIAYHYVGDIKKRDLYFGHARRLGYLRLQTLQDTFDGKLTLRDEK